MKKVFLSAALVLAVAGAALAQGPVITSVIPMANARAASRTSPLTVNFSQTLTAASAGALKVFSSQRGGLRTRGTTPAVVSGNALSFAPLAYDFRPGETVQYTVTTAAAGSGGPLAQGRVGQFTAAVGGTGQGTFLPGINVAVGRSPFGVVAGDVDGDGDLDLLTANGSANTVSVRLNNGSGVFGNGTDVPVGSIPSSIVLGDVDGDGDLDFLVVNGNASGSVSIRFNNGSGLFSGGQDVSSTGIGNIALGDVDGDGDLDFLVTNRGYPGQVRLCRNSGTGTFSGGQSIAVPLAPTVVASSLCAALGDVDNDGDLDLLVTNYNFGGAPASNTVSVLRNDGTGAFSSSTSVVVGAGPENLAVGDVDGDGDPDLLTANYVSTVSVRLNDGAGIFSGTQEVPIGVGINNITVGDVDGDGDLDLLTSNASDMSVSVRQNNGSGIFSGTQEVGVGGGPYSVAVADVDGDGDLDLLAANSSAPSTVSIRLNGSTGPLATAVNRSTPALVLFPNPAQGAATLTGAAPFAPLAVLDVLGRARLTATADATGAARLALPTGLPAGVYLVRTGGQVRRLVVE